jgi:hypothetical protein
MADSLDECVAQLKAGILGGMKLKGLRVNLHEENQALIWCLDLQGWTFSKTPAPSHVLSVERPIPSSAHNVDCGYIRNVAMDMENSSSIQTTSAQDTVTLG